MGKEGSILAYAAPAVEPEPATAFCTRAAYQEMRPYVVLERPMTAHRGGLFKQRRACYMNGREGGPSLPTLFWRGVEQPGSSSGS
jgi:hypothetical protein